MSFAALINQYKNSDQNKKGNWTFEIDFALRSTAKKHIPNPRTRNGSIFYVMTKQHLHNYETIHNCCQPKKQIFFKILTFFRLMDSSEAFLNCSWPTLELIDPPGPVTALASRPGKIRPKPLWSHIFFLMEFQNL